MDLDNLGIRGEELREDEEEFDINGEIIKKKVPQKVTKSTENLCEYPRVKGGYCTRKGNKPDGHCHQHCSEEFRVKRLNNKETLQKIVQEQREINDDLVARLRSIFQEKLRETEKKMEKMVTSLEKEVETLRVNNAVQERLLSFYTSIIRENINHGNINLSLSSAIEKKETVEEIVEEKETVEEIVEEKENKPKIKFLGELDLEDLDMTEEEFLEFEREEAELDAYREEQKEIVRKRNEEIREIEENFKKGIFPSRIKNKRKELPKERIEEIKRQVEECEKEQGFYPLLPGEKKSYFEDGTEDEELPFKEREKLYEELYTESTRRTGDLPNDFWDRFKMVFSKERRKTLFRIEKPPVASEERDEKLIQFYQDQYDAGLIDSVPKLEDIPGSTLRKPVGEIDYPAPKEKIVQSEFITKFLSSAANEVPGPCFFCKVKTAPVGRSSCDECYSKTWRCKALTKKGAQCPVFTKSSGPYCKRHIDYRPEEK